MNPKRYKNKNKNTKNIHKPFKEIEDDNPRQFDQV